MNLLTAVSAFITLLLILGGPLPLCRAISVRALPPWSTTVGEQWLAVALLWLALQLSGTTLLAASGYFTLAGLFVWQCLLLGIGLYWQASLPMRPNLRLRLSLPRWTALFVTLLLFGNLLSQPITDYDSLYYHLPFVANLHATGGLTTATVATVVAWYPFGWETLAALFVLPLQQDLLVTLPNLLVWGSWGVALYCLARRLGASPAAAGSAVLLLLTQPLVIDQLNTVRVDLAIAAFFTMGLAFALLYHQTRRQGNLLLALLCLPLLAACKSSGLIYGLLLLLILGACWLRQMRPLINHSDLRALGAVLGLTAAAASFWYLNNWYYNGNPLGAVAIQLGSWTLFPGALTSEALRRTMLLSIFNPGDLAHWRALGMQLWQQGGIAGAMLGILTLCLCWPRRRRRWQWRAVGALALLGSLLVAIYWVTPYSGDDGSYGYQLTAQWLGQSFRFALAASAVLALLAALGGSQLPGRLRWLPHLGSLLGLLGLAQRSTLYLLAVTVFILLVAGWFGLSRQHRLLSLRNRLQSFVTTYPQLLVVGAVLLLWGGALALQPLREQRRLHAYGELPQVVTRISPQPTTIAALYSHQSYLAAGTRLQHRVVQAPLTLRTAAELQHWLGQQAIDFVIIGPLRPEWQAEALVVELATIAPFDLIYDGSPNHPQFYALKRP